MSETLEALIKELIKYDHKTILVDEAVDLFMNKCQSTVKPQTCEYYKKHLSKIASFLCENRINHVDQINNDVMYQYIAQEKARKLKNNSINKAVECLQFVLNYCYKHDYINQNPLKSFKKLPSDDIETKTINEDTLKNIFIHMSQLPRTPINVRDHLMVALLIDTGVRRSEMRNIKVENVNLRDKSIYLTQTKTNKNRYLFISEMTVKLIQEYLSIVPAKGFLLVNIKNYEEQISNHIIDRTLEKIKEDLQIPKSVSISPHKWRHTYATMCLNNGADIVFVQKFLGHSTLRMTQRYTHKENDRLKKEHDQFSPAREL